MSKPLFQRGEEDGDSDLWDDTALIKAYDNAVSAMKTKLAAQHPEYSIPNTPVSKKKKKSKQKIKKKKCTVPVSSHGWKVGDFCQAFYTEDGELYSAQIILLQDEDTCVVRYIDYGNEEEQSLDSLLPIGSDASSQDNKTDTASEIDSVCETTEGKHTMKSKSHKGTTYVGGKPSRSSAPPWNWNNFTVPHPPPPSANNFPPFPHPSNFATPGFGLPPQYSPMFPGIPPPPPVFNYQSAENENEALYSMLISWYMSGYHTGYYQGLKSSKSSVFGGPHR